MVVDEPRQRLLVRGPLSAGRASASGEPEASEEQLAKLLRAVWIEARPGVAQYRLRHGEYFAVQLPAVFPQRRRVDADPGAFNVQKDLHERLLYVSKRGRRREAPVRGPPAQRKRLRAQHALKAQRDVGILGGIVDDLGNVLALEGWLGSSSLRLACDFVFMKTLVKSVYFLIYTHIFPYFTVHLRISYFK